MAASRLTALLVFLRVADSIEAPQFRLHTGARRARAPAMAALGSDELRPGEDLHKILGVSDGATSEQIRRAFRARARRLHPDVNPSADAARSFRRLALAHEILSDPTRRRAWHASSQPAWEWSAAPRGRTPPRQTARPAQDGWAPALSYVLGLYLTWGSLLWALKQ